MWFINHYLLLLSIWHSSHSVPSTLCHKLGVCEALRENFLIYGLASKQT